MSSCRDFTFGVACLSRAGGDCFGGLELVTRGQSPPIKGGDLSLGRTTSGVCWLSVGCPLFRSLQRCGFWGFVAGVSLGVCWLSLGRECLLVSFARLGSLPFVGCAAGVGDVIAGNIEEVGAGAEPDSVEDVVGGDPNTRLPQVCPVCCSVSPRAASCLPAIVGCAGTGGWCLGRGGAHGRLVSLVRRRRGVAPC